METDAGVVPALRRSLILLFLLLPLLAAQRVFVVSFDGLGHEILQRDAVAQELRTLWRIRRAGVMAEGVQPAFPSTTANSHCAIFHGAYGNVTHITGNSPLVLPRAEHRFSERTNGFLATQVPVEPVWVTAARQGVPVVAHNVTQALPFLPRNTHAGAVVVNSYQSRRVTPHAAVRASDTVPEDTAVWRGLPRSNPPPKAFSWSNGPYRLHGALLGSRGRYNRLWISLDPGHGERVEARHVEAETEPPSNRALARHFSEVLPVREPAPSGFFFRLFELTADGSDFLLYQSPIQETAASDGGFPALLTIPAVGNGAVGLLHSGGLGDPALSARRYLETVELATRQLAAQFQALLAHRDARLAVTYLPFPDEIDHEWIARDRRGESEARALRRWGYQIIERFMQAVDRAGPRDHVIFLSDHGMGEVDRAVAVNAALRAAGLEGLAAHHYNSIIVNTTDWLEGKVPAEEKLSLLRRAREALAALRDPDTGQPVFTSFFTPEEHAGQFGIGGAAGADLYFDLAPGWRALDAAEPPVLRRLPTPVGVHGFFPLRADMLAMLVARGPRLPVNASWPRLRSIQVVPLLCDLLGIQPPAHAVAPSPLAVSSIAP